MSTKNITGTSAQTFSDFQFHNQFITGEVSEGQSKTEKQYPKQRSKKRWIKNYGLVASLNLNVHRLSININHLIKCVPEPRKFHTPMDPKWGGGPLSEQFEAHTELPRNGLSLRWKYICSALKCLSCESLVEWPLASREDTRWLGKLIPVIFLLGCVCLSVFLEFTSYIHTY